MSDSCFVASRDRGTVLGFVCLLVFAVFGVLGVLGCGDSGSPIIVTISPLPAGSSKIKAMASLGQTVAPEAYSFSVSKDQARQDFTFSFHSPTDRTSQSLVIGSVVSDDHGCTLAVGASAPSSVVDTLKGIEVRLVMLPVPDCSEDVPRSLLVTPQLLSSENGSLADKKATVRVLGWGFRPGIGATFGGLAATAVRWKSVVEIEADVPWQKGTPRPLGPLAISVRNPDGASDERDDLLRRGFYASLGLQRVSPGGTAASPDALADLNQDGRVDLLSIDAAGKSVLVYLAKADSTYPTSPTYRLTFTEVPLSIAAVDVHGDGKPDLIVGMMVTGVPPSRTPTVAVLVNIGNGLVAPTFASYLIGAAPTEIMGIDVNQDGKQDLVVNTRADAISILLNQGGGVFPLAAQSYAAGGAIQSVQVADVNEDRLPDLIINARTGADPGGSVKIFWAQTTGEFSATPLSPFLARQADSVRVLDLNHDGRLDLVALLPDSASVLLNQGQGVFPPQALTVSFGVSTTTALGVFADVFETNEDDLPDLVFDAGDGTLRVLRNTGNGSFSDAAISSPAVVAQSLIRSDWNGDGRSDLLAVTSSGALSFLVNQNNGSFVQFPNKLGSLMGSASLYPVDFDSDGKPDLIAYGGGQTYLLRNLSQ